jgi:hypothetical protein
LEWVVPRPLDPVEDDEGLSLDFADEGAWTRQTFFS